MRTLLVNKAPLKANEGSLSKSPRNREQQVNLMCIFK